MLLCDSLAKVDRYVEYCNELMDACGMFNGKVRIVCWAAVKSSVLYWFLLSVNKILTEIIGSY